MNNKIKNNIELPSNKKFGYFFTFIFLCSSTYFYFEEISFVFYALGLISIIFFFITIFKAEILRPLNKLWMSFGLILGLIVSPIVMGVIFFLIFTPIGILMRVLRKDLLNLKFSNLETYWIEKKDQKSEMKNQF